MEDIFECWMELQKRMLMSMLNGKMDVYLTGRDFEMHYFFFAEKYSRHFSYDNQDTIKNCNWFKVAGPASYITFRRFVDSTGESK